jgi:hypothetical protein
MKTLEIVDQEAVQSGSNEAQVRTNLCRAFRAAGLSQVQSRASAASADLSWFTVKGTENNGNVTYGKGGPEYVGDFVLRTVAQIQS